jgi:hypothetical protein
MDASSTLQDDHESALTLQEDLIPLGKEAVKRTYDEAFEEDDSSRNGA